MAAVETREKVSALGEKYKYGFVTDIEMERAPKGLSEDTVRYISAKKSEPEWMLEWRLAAFKRWREMREPNWARVHYPKIDYQGAYYYAAPKNTPQKQSLDEVDPKLLETYNKLGIPLNEQMLLAGVAVDAVFDSVSVATTFKAKLSEAGVIFCPFSEVRAIIPISCANILAFRRARKSATISSRTLNSGGELRRRHVHLCAEGVRCPMELLNLFPHQRERDRAVPGGAAADRQQTKARMSAISKAAPRARSATRNNLYRCRRSWSRSTAQRSNTRRCRTGALRRRERARRHLQFRH